jgi:hypothetical protein
VCPIGGAKIVHVVGQGSKLEEPASQPARQGSIFLNSLMAQKEEYTREREKKKIMLNFAP